MSFQLRDAHPADGGAIRAVVESVLSEYRLGTDPAKTDADLQDIEAHYTKRGGVFRVLTDESGTVVGCGGLYPLANDEAEIRKMYFLPNARGHGYGRRLLTELLAEATKRGYRRVLLETASVLKEAIGLYRSAGFKPCERELASRCDQAMSLDLTR